jgi:hypothetical protein
VKPMRPLVSFLHGKVSCPSWLWKIWRRWNWESLLGSARRHHATCRAHSPILCGLTPPNMRLGNSRRVPQGNWLGQGCHTSCGVLHWSMNCMFAPTLHMTSIS